MGNLHLVTGYAGTPHVASSDHGSFYEGLIRGGQFVMEAGAKFAASIVTNNQIKVNDGELMMQGRHVKLTPGAYVDLAIENGTQGYLRNDLIVARYTRNTNNNVEECNLVVIKGTPVTSNPADPKYSSGSINASGALQHDFPLYRVSLSGLSITKLTALFEAQKPLFDALLRLTGGTMSGNIAMGGKKITGLGDPTANGDAVPLSYANEKFALAEYGLGATGKDCADCNTATKNGWYSLAGENCLNTPPSVSSMKYGIMLVMNRYDSLIVQVIFYQKNMAIRNSINGGEDWTEWEHINPLLLEGVEYRTTDRYKGSAVYKKVDANGDILWRLEGEARWRLLTSANYITTATVE